MQQHGKPCIACAKLEELLALKPDYLVESVSPAAMRELALPALRNGTSVITLSIGALADETFYRGSDRNRQSKWYTGLYCIRSYRWIRCFKNCLSDGKYDGTASSMKKVLMDSKELPFMMIPCKRSNVLFSPVVLRKLFASFQPK